MKINHVCDSARPLQDHSPSLHKKKSCDNLHHCKQYLTKVCFQIKYYFKIKNVQIL